MYVLSSLNQWIKIQIYDLKLQNLYYLNKNR
jgi:hypothetical protein